MQYTLGMVTVGTIFSSNIDLSKNKNIEDKKIKHTSEKFVIVIMTFLFLVSSALPRTAFL